MNFGHVQLLKEYFSWLKASLKIFHTQCLIYLNPCSTYKVVQFTLFFHFKSKGSFNCTTSSQVANIFHQTLLRIRLRMYLYKDWFLAKCGRYSVLFLASGASAFTTANTLVVVTGSWITNCFHGNSEQGN